MTIGIVLAGGKSSRMGSDKAVITINGVPMINIVASALQSVCEKVVIVGRKDGPVEGVEYLPDEGLSYRGPLGGIVTAMQHLESDLLVVAVDQPGVNPTTLQHLVALGKRHAVIPESGGWLQVTCAWYPKDLLPTLSDALAAGDSLRWALRSQKVRKVSEQEWESWGETGESWRSLDSPSDVTAYAKSKPKFSP